MRIRAIDIGGTGVKTAAFRTEGAKVVADGPYEKLGVPPDWQAFEHWLSAKINLDADCVAVSCAGLVDSSTGRVRHCGVAGWVHRPLGENLRALCPGARVHVLNDAEAHLYAHVSEAPRPLLVVAVGSALGLAMTDEDGRFVRTRGTLPIELGILRLATSASRKEAWWALGRPGFDELVTQRGEEGAVEQFGYRLGAFLAQMAGVFLPRSIVVSGGFAAHYWPRLRSPVEHEFRQTLPDYVRDDPPTIQNSPYGRQAALVGVARYAARPDC
jgi:predicted NBD/HSP70 family sugar kinase